MKINSKEIEQISYNVARKRKKEIANNKEKGITLIALVVTIVVLLILAGITITFVLGEGGILDMAKEAAKRTNEAKEQELKDFADFQNQVENWVNGGTSSGGGSTSGDVTPPADPSPTPEQSTTKTLEEAKTQKDPFEETTKVKDDDKTMTIPAGFKITEGESIDEGVVVQDRAKNEFVWVPVAINDMVMCRTHPTAKISYKDGEFSCEGQEHKPDQTELVGKLYTFSGNKSTPMATYNANSGYREPAIVTNSSNGEGTSYDGDSNNFNKVVEGAEKTRAKFLEQLQNEFYNMAKSVAENGGFYIGRYETSGLKDGETPIVQKGKDPTVSTDWYTMYKNSKEIGKEVLKDGTIEKDESSSVTSSMIWGCQWDAVMNWMKNVTNPTITSATKYFITDSSGMGWYSGVTGSDGNSNSEHKTGVNLINDQYPEVVLNRVKNIYDLAGNMYDWTLEACVTNSRINRGGDYSGSGSISPASHRYNIHPTSSDFSYISSRSTLYVNL